MNNGNEISFLLNDLYDKLILIFLRFHFSIYIASLFININEIWQFSELIIQT